MEFVPKEFITSSNKFIHVYDDCIDYRSQEMNFYFVKNSLFKTSGVDSETSISNTNYSQIYSRYTIDDFKKMFFLKSDIFSFFNDKYNLPEKQLTVIRVNCSNCFEYSTAHTDLPGVTILCYLNMQWNPFFGGHTFFYDESAKEIEYTAVCKPNRIVVFDGLIPHSISPISVVSRDHRFSLVLQYLNKDYKD